MDIQKIQQYKTAFDQIAKTVKDDRERLRASEKQRRVAKDEKEMQKENQKLPKK